MFIGSGLKSGFRVFLEKQDICKTYIVKKKRYFLVSVFKKKSLHEYFSRCVFMLFACVTVVCQNVCYLRLKPKLCAYIICVIKNKHCAA